MHCTQGQALLNTVLVSREQVIPRGIPQLEDRTLETVQQEWVSYQTRLSETRSQLNSTIAKLRQMEQKFQRLDNWLKGMENKGQLRSCRRSDKATKEAQLELLKVCGGTISFNGAEGFGSNVKCSFYLHFGSAIMFIVLYRDGMKKSLPTRRK